MLKKNETISISKFLSLVLRHKPEIIGLQLNENGWADVAALIDKMNAHNFKITPAILNEVVATNNKQRFAFNEDKTKIRASQGHSIQVNLHLQQMNPPQYLYHGTGEKAVASILKSGLQKRARQHVHLSVDIPTAIAVGKRHGNPRVFIIAAQQMQQDGYTFYLSENKVWLTDNVPATYLKLLKE